MKPQPMGMLLMMLAGWLNRHQQDVIEYLKEENKILREKLGTKRILTPGQEGPGRCVPSLFARHHPRMAPPSCGSQV